MTRDGSTSEPPAAPTLAAVWVVDLDGIGADAVDDLARRWLDREERSGAAAKRDPSDRRRVLASHLALRLVLGSWLGRHPAEVRLTRAACPLCREPHGRPVLDDPAWRASRSFSLSRSGDLAAVVVASGPLAVGIDIEARPPLVGADDLHAGRHPDEDAALAALPHDQRDLAALRCWTRTEAVLKGWGTGLGVDPAAVAVGLGSSPPPGEVDATPIGPVTLPEHDLRRAPWTVVDVGVAAPAVVAAAVGSNQRSSADDAAPPVEVEVHEVALDELLARHPDTTVIGARSG